MPIALALAFSGCATPGPLHVYSLAPAAAAQIHDAHAGREVSVPSFVNSGEAVRAFGYDPFTDHYFLALRVDSGANGTSTRNVIRVIDRPARAVKREFPLLYVNADQIADLAIKPSTGHLFLLDAATRRIVQLTRFGKLVRHISLPAGDDPLDGIAYDGTQDRLLVLRSADAPNPEVAVLDLAGKPVGSLRLDRPVLASLAFDAAAREFYAPLPGVTPTAGVFDEHGRFMRSVPTNGAWVDVGPRSFIRVF